MTTIWDWIEKDLNPPGIHQVNRRKLYRITGRIGQQVADDMARSKREFFGRLALDTAGHGATKNIPRLPHENTDSYRQRLGRAGEVLESSGEVAPLKAYLDRYIPGRWILQDAPRDFFRIGNGRIGKTPVGCPPTVIVYVVDLTTDEQAQIEQFLDWFLGADIQYRVLSGGYPLPVIPLSLEQLRNSGGSSWLDYHLSKVAPVEVSLLPDDAIGIGRGKGVGASRIYRGSGDYIVIQVAPGHKEAISARLDLLVDSSIDVIYEEERVG